MLTRSIIELHGTTGLQVGDELLRQARHFYKRDWLPFWQVIAVETTQEVPLNLPRSWRFIPLGDSLDRAYERREQFDIPEAMKQLPKEAWQDLRDGAGKMPAASAVAYAVHRRTLENCRQQAWHYLQDQQQLFYDWQAWASSDQPILSNDSPLVILAGATGGGTGPAGILNGVRFWIQHQDRPRILVFAIGPHCGQGVGRVEFANAARLMASLTQISATSPQLWVFWVDGQPRQRGFLLREAVSLIFALIGRPEGSEMRRLLHDGFSKARRQFNGCICRADFARLRIADNLRRQAAEDLLLEALEEIERGEHHESN